jgi:hypothetical protein
MTADPEHSRGRHRRTSRPVQTREPPRRVPAAPGHGHVAAGRSPDQQASSLPEATRGRPAFPGAPASAPTFEDEISTALSYEKGLAVKSLIAVAIVLIVVAIRIFFLG